jgi:hypothetical protein
VANSKQRAVRSVPVVLAGAAVALVFGALVFGLRVSRAAHEQPSKIAQPPKIADAAAARTDREAARQVTVFAVLAKPGAKGADAKLSAIKPQLERLLPDHSFKILDVQSKRLTAGDGLDCDLGNGGYIARTSLIEPDDGNGKVELRCELWLGKVRQFSTQVKTPTNQLFFCERALGDGSRLLIGIGAR